MKHKILPALVIYTESPPVRGRGLKHSAMA